MSERGTCERSHLSAIQTLRHLVVSLALVCLPSTPRHYWLTSSFLLSSCVPEQSLLVCRPRSPRTVRSGASLLCILRPLPSSTSSYGLHHTLLCAYSFEVVCLPSSTRAEKGRLLSSLHFADPVSRVLLCHVVSHPCVCVCGLVLSDCGYRFWHQERGPAHHARVRRD